ncbi:uncharacterized protein LOC132638503 [Lycium barbarum]|uniref:uncharacterized protein LOC132638503 n=1 Tax=Lycium barbarum TaxID=112863 RepID=UPI00293F0090|nr:uncharacterized protein LOC132638503 [Lycium barbarum]XP_060211341.1 uncharacterized protein LOC132638503 [Lycium barbarum]XP_060211342.1 uncharacterized protein LOC132638503 [Lycium barbarum]
MYRSPPPLGNNNRITYPQSSSYPQNRSHLFYDYCKRHGHTRDKCYKIHGYPQNFKFTRGKNTGSIDNVHTNEAEKGYYEEKHETKREGKMNLLMDQYEQLLNLLGNLQSRKGPFLKSPLEIGRIRNGCIFYAQSVTLVAHLLLVTVSV